MRSQGKQSQQQHQGKQGRSGSMESNDEDETASEGTPRKRKTSKKNDDTPCSNNDNRNDNNTSTEDGVGNSGSDDRGSKCAKSNDEGRDAVVGCDALLRFPGFGLNMGGKECLSCYQAENIMINFGCEVKYCLNVVPLLFTFVLVW